MALDLGPVRARFPGRRIEWLETCSSTMSEAVPLAESGCASGSLVGAEEQTAGRGRLGRRWHSRPGEGLYVSFILRQPAGPLPLALGLAAAEATGLKCDLRWPNDVLLAGKKCAGVLVEALPGAFIAGIGINVNQAEFPPDLALIATSLRLATGREQPREAVLERLIEAVDRFAALDAPAIVGRFTAASSYARGRRVVVDQCGPGTTDGLDPSGFLWLRKDDGTRELILSGGVRPAEKPGTVHSITIFENGE